MESKYIKDNTKSVFPETQNYLEEVKEKASEINVSFCLFIAAALVLGTILRLYMVSDQILLDDEWHGMDYVVGNSFFYLFTHFSIPGATCIPMNLYRLFLLKTCGWSELSLRLPSLSAGILSLVVFPLLARKILNLRSTIIFAFLLAISPFLIFYSRVCRPYSMVVLLGFVSVLALYFWAISGKKRYALLYVTSAVLAVYFHLFAAITVFVPLGCVFSIKLVQNLIGLPKERIRIVPSLITIATVGLGVMMLLAFLLLPALLQSSIGTIGIDKMTLKSIMGFVSILSGTSNKFIVVLFCLLLGFGQILLLRKIPLLGSFFLSIAIFYFATLVITKPGVIHFSIVIARYVIFIFPMCFLLVGLGIDSALKYLQSIKLIQHRGYDKILSIIIVATFLLILFCAGPLINLYAGPNNFTNHFTFQGSYSQQDWQQSYISDLGPGFGVSKTDTPDFYRWLSTQPEISTIIEYPMDIRAECNFLYYYQHFHNKNVIVGYVSDSDVLGYVIEPGLTETEIDDFFITGYYIDAILSALSDKSKLLLTNMIDLMNIETVKQSNAQYIILHKNPMVEMTQDFTGGKVPIYMPIVQLSELYRKFFGQAVFEDRNLIVYKIHTNEKQE